MPTFFGGDMNRLALVKNRGLDEDAMFLEVQESTGTLDYNVKFGAQFKHPDHGAMGQAKRPLVCTFGAMCSLFFLSRC